MLKGLLAAVAIACVILLAATRPPAANASCVASVNWGGVQYQGLAPPKGRKLSLGARLGRARVPPCIDTVPAPPAQPDTFRRIRRIKGVSPAIAVSDVRGRSVYAAEGYFLTLPSHPLNHLYGARSFLLSKTSIRSCKARPSVRGRVTGGFDSINLIDDRGRAREITVSPHARFHGFLRNGLPFLQTGDRVRVAVKKCVLRLGARILVARSVAPR